MRLILPVLTVAFMVSGCGPTTPYVPPAVPEDTASGLIWPIGQNAYWLFRQQSEGNWETLDTTYASGPFTLQPIGYFWFYIPMPSLAGLFRLDTLGVQVAISDSAVYTGFDRFINHPSSAGQEWTIGNGFGFSVPTQVRYAGPGLSVDVPAGRFTDCREYIFTVNHEDNRRSVITWYFQPGVGPVWGTDNYYKDGQISIRYTYELVATHSDAGIY